MIHQVYLAEREVIHVLRCMCLMEAISGEELMAFIGTGFLDCDSLAITCTREDFIVVALMIGEAQTLFETLEGLHSCAPLCMGMRQLEANHQCSICLEDEECGNWVPRLECGHLFHDGCLLRWAKGTSDMKNSCPECRRPINNKKQIRIRIVDYDHNVITEH